MKRTIYLVAFVGLLISCAKKNNSDSTIVGNVKETTETRNGITYKSFISTTPPASYKGILVMGSGNDEDDPTVGSLDGSPENALCLEAAQNGYVAAIVQYRQTPGTKNWDESAQMVGEDYNSCITALSSEFGVAKSNSVVGGYSYASFMLLTNSAYYNDLSYCKGLLAPCGGTEATDLRSPYLLLPAVATTKAITREPLFIITSIPTPRSKQQAQELQTTAVIPTAAATGPTSYMHKW